ncbi:DUF1003 domain-containing protein [Anaeromyxobacter diazotrophicus]|uniref:DUF1003 domain-containing protein n=1 Tax=Anaeromyxobacter diazotrophicus TaxID=2590199 RepID=A0A7I9VSU4_9BACT|nr:DUF1003 domain-containing protein [Anaeromyxobacter diazotrophicus]GEJ59371.1 hypothetical protein AMYX_41120 [Anaeromyxobacter diazotrophicus]
MPHDDHEVLAPILDRNIRALVERRRTADRTKGWQERLADAITRFTGSLPFVYVHLALFGGWILWNLPGSPLPRFDAQYVILAMAASVEAIFLSTFILISQNRMQALADERADLNVQVSLLSEHEVTRLIRLVKRMAERMGVEESGSPELDELERDVRPEKVLEHLQHVNDSGPGEPR